DTRVRRDDRRGGKVMTAPREGSVRSTPAPGFRPRPAAGSSARPPAAYKGSRGAKWQLQKFSKRDGNSGRNPASYRFDAPASSCVAGTDRRGCRAGRSEPVFVAEPAGLAG